MKPKTKFEIIAGIIQSILGFTMVFSLYYWFFLAATQGKTFKSQLWSIINLTSAVIFFVNWFVLKQIEYRYFPEDIEEQAKKIPKYRNRKWSKICLFSLFCGALIAAISGAIAAYIVGIVSTKDLNTPFISTIFLILTILVFIGLVLVVAAVIMIFAGALKSIEEEEVNK